MIAIEQAAQPAGLTCERLLPSKIGPTHLERLAVVYVRQSTGQQVLEHRESAALQYALRSRAVQWGWPEQRVVVIDQDQGRSGASVEGRLGFQQLLAEVSLDHVGVVLGIEMSRLARSCRDWHQLLELCALFGTLLADTDGLYDPRDYNDRLLLGLKGTLSEAELHVLRQRMNQGRLNKAKRGELFNHPPIGYLLQWHRPNRQTLRNLLHHPVYAGAYTWGRRAVDPRRKVPGRPATGRQVVVAEQCQVLLKDRCPAYITWQQYEANRKRLADNRCRADAQGPAREGPSLLGGLLVCGRCGRRMTVQYSGRSNRLRYACTRGYTDYGGEVCQGICGSALDEMVARLMLSVLEPAALELSLAAAQDLERERQRLDEHWGQRLERSRYESDRAARQYHAVEPENRLVARELEKRWEQSLAGQRQAQEAYDRFLGERPVALSDADRAALRRLGDDIPALWQSPLTTAAERQQIARCLIERVVVTAPSDSEVADVAVHWAGGYVSRRHLLRPVARYEQLRDYQPLSRRILELRELGRTSAQIAAQLNTEGWHPPKRRATFNAGMVRQVLCRRGEAPTRPVAHALGPDEYWLNDLARMLALPHPTLYNWMRRGWVIAAKLTPGHPAAGRWVFWADARELDRLRRLRACPRSWHCRPQAADLTRPHPPDTRPNAG